MWPTAAGTYVRRRRVVRDLGDGRALVAFDPARFWRRDGFAKRARRRAAAPFVYGDDRSLDELATEGLD